MNLQNLKQKYGMPVMIKIIQNMVKKLEMIEALNLRQKVSNEVIIQMHIFL